MMDFSAGYDLGPVFLAARDVLEQNRLAFDQADQLNGNHGSHMVQVFDLAARAALDQPRAELGEMLLAASQELRRLADNGSAQLYAVGLEQFALQFQKRGITRQELITYVQALVEDQPEDRGDESSGGRKAEILKALVGGLAGWQQSQQDAPESNPLQDMGYFFELGMIYWRAKQAGGTRAEILANTAVAASPLSQLPLRSQSGRLALLAVLQGMSRQGLRSG
jgi:hypothetical protein